MNETKAPSFQTTVTATAELKRKDASKRALAALKEMQEKALTINFNSLANYANVSKAWLYRHPEIRQQILAVREQSQSFKRMTTPAKLIERKDAEITKLKLKVAKFTAENKKLKKQIELIYGELYKK
jgi:hypothetical protein